MSFFFFFFANNILNFLYPRARTNRGSLRRPNVWSNPFDSKRALYSDQGFSTFLPSRQTAHEASYYARPPPPMYTRCLARDLRTYYYCLSYDDRWMQNVVQIACTADSIRTGPAEVNGVTCSPSCPNSSRSPTRTTSTWPCTLTGRRGRVDAPSGWRRNWRQGRKLMRYAPSLDKRIS